MSDEEGRRPRPLTTESGAPVTGDQRSRTPGADGPVLVQGRHLLDKLAPFDRKRLPERVVHAGHLAQMARKEIIDRSISHVRKADPGYGARLEQAVEAHKARPP